MAKTKAPKEVKKAKKKRSEKSENTGTELFKYLDDTRIVEKAILRNFVDWFAIPKSLRRPKTMSEFAKQFGVSKDTLTDWTKLSGFYDEVGFILDRFIKYTPDVVYGGWVKPAMNGNTKAADSYMAYFKGFKQKRGFADTNNTPKQLDEEMLKKIEKAFGHQGKTEKQISIITKGL